MTTVTVLSKPTCVQCNSTYRRLDKNEIEYEVVDMSKDKQALDLAKTLGHFQAPVVLVHQGDWTSFEPTDQNTHWSGYRPDKIDALAARLAQTV